MHPGKTTNEVEGSYFEMVSHLGGMHVCQRSPVMLRNVELKTASLFR